MFDTDIKHNKIGENTEHSSHDDKININMSNSNVI